MHTRQVRLLVALASLLGAAAAATAQEAFPFVIPWDEASPGTATDVSFLNTVPAGANGRIITRDGQFVEQDTGKRVRFLGTNFSGSWNFPTHEDAEKVAARLAKYGVNIVRLHHMDNTWDRAGGSGIWKAGDPRCLELDPERLDRLDYLVAQLKARGIYVNINLKVSKKLTEADGFPKSVTDFKWSYQKRVDIFNDRMIELQKDYARRLLTHVNPYTGMSYVDDPCVAMVEINNENSLVGWSSSPPGGGLDGMPEPFRGELVSLWNEWLAEHYDSDEALLAAWVGDEPAPTDVPAPTTGQTAWQLSYSGKAQAKLTTGDNRKTIDASAKVEATRVDGTDWHIQLHAKPITLVDDAFYTLRFRARSSERRKVRVSAMRDTGDYRNSGLSKTFWLTEDWDDFEVSFKASRIDPEHTRLTFNFGAKASTVWLEDVRLELRDQDDILPEGQSLARRSVDMPGSSSENANRDWVRFLVEVEEGYVDTMRELLRDELGVKSNLTDTQVNYGGVAGYAREASLDYADIHMYWKHPDFHGGGWGTDKWTIPSVSLVSDWVQGRPGTLGQIATHRWAGRPFSVSEYDHPFPNPYGIEMMPLYASFSAAQDWDAIYTFDYGPYGEGRDNTRVSRFFDHGNNPGKFGFYPAAAMLFRAELIEPASVQQVLQLPKRPHEKFSRVGDAWAAAKAERGVPTFLSSRWAVETNPSPAVVQPTVSRTGTPGGKSQLRIESAEENGVFVGSSPAAAVVVGFVGGKTIDAGDVALQFGEFPTSFAAVAVTAMDGKPLASSKRILVTVMGRVENKNMGWNEARTSVGHKWGEGPTQILAVPMTASVGTARPLTAYPLSPDGSRKAALGDAASDGKRTTFSTDVAHGTVWYELAAE